jgi:hypothetical protein
MLPAGKFSREIKNRATGLTLFSASIDNGDLLSLFDSYLSIVKITRAMLHPGKALLARVFPAGFASRIGLNID